LWLRNRKASRSCIRPAHFPPAFPCPGQSVEAGSIFSCYLSYVTSFVLFVTFVVKIVFFMSTFSLHSKLFPVGVNLFVQNPQYTVRLWAFIISSIIKMNIERPASNTDIELRTSIFCVRYSTFYIRRSYFIGFLPEKNHFYFPGVPDFLEKEPAGKRCGRIFAWPILHAKDSIVVQLFKNALI